MTATSETRISLTRSSHARAILIDLARILAFFQFLFLYLPFGFSSIAGINAPFTNSEFLVAFFAILVIPGPVLGVLVVILMKMQRKAGAPGSWAFLEKRPAVMEGVSYACFVMSAVLFFINQHGWLSELWPMMLFLSGIFISGTLAMFGIMAPRASFAGIASGASNALGLLVIGALYAIPALLGLQYLILDEAIVSIAIPPLLAIGRLEPVDHTGIEANLAPTPFAWCDPALSHDGARGWMGSMIMLTILLAVSNFFSTIYVLIIPFPDFVVQALLFFACTASGLLIFMAVFDRRQVNAVIFITLLLLAITYLLDQFVARFSYGPIAQVMDGFALGGALTLFFRFQDSRNTKLRLSDFAGSRIVEFFYIILTSAILSLAFNLTIHTGDFMDNVLSSPTIPFQLLVGATLLGIVAVSLLVFHAITRYKIKNDHETSRA